MIVSSSCGAIPNRLALLRRRGDEGRPVALFLFGFQEMQGMGSVSDLRRVSGNLTVLRKEMGEEAFRKAASRVNDIVQEEFATAVDAWLNEHPEERDSRSR